jgi:hypothetical protein
MLRQLPSGRHPRLDLLSEADLDVLGQQRISTDLVEVHPHEIVLTPTATFPGHRRSP